MDMVMPHSVSGASHRCAACSPEKQAISLRPILVFHAIDRPGIAHSCVLSKRPHPAGKNGEARDITDQDCARTSSIAEQEAQSIQHGDCTHGPPKPPQLSAIFRVPLSRRSARAIPRMECIVMRPLSRTAFGEHFGCGSRVD